MVSPSAGTGRKIGTPTIRAKSGLFYLAGMQITGAKREYDACTPIERVRLAFEPRPVGCQGTHEVDALHMPPAVATGGTSVAMM